MLIFVLRCSRRVVVAAWLSGLCCSSVVFFVVVQLDRCFVIVVRFLIFRLHVVLLRFVRLTFSSVLGCGFYIRLCH